MTIKALQDYTFTAKYANYIPEKKRRETWNEAVERVKNMMFTKYADFDIKEEINWAYELVKQKRVIGSQRAMQFGGKPVLSKNARIYNCISSYCDRIDFFKECFFLLLCGNGCGFSTQKHHVEKLPLLRDNLNFKKYETYIVEDSIEGWADSLDVLLRSYLVSTNDYTRITFDFTKIRPKGAKLSHGMGKAPGPEILENALNKIRKLIEKEISEGRTKIKPIVAYDIIMYCADAVVAGGHRRSATINLFSFDDEEMMNAKTGNWFYENPQRGRSNNSVVLKRDETTLKQFKEIINKTRQFGEPGFIFVDDLEQTTNPSLRAKTKVLTDSGIYNIEELEGKGFYITNMNGESARAECKLSGKQKQLYKIRLDGNKEYYATEEHKWPVYFDRLIEKKETKELKVGYEIPFIGKDVLFDGEGSYNYNDGFLGGWNLGDGWITQRSDNGKFQYGFIVSYKDQEYGIIDKLDESIYRHKQNSINKKHHWTGRKSVYEISLQSNAVHNFFVDIGQINKENGVCEHLWKSNEEFRRGYIDGLFSSDGHITDSKITLCSSKINIINDIKEILGFYGINTRIYKKVIDGSKCSFPNGKKYNKTYTSYRLSTCTKNDMCRFAKIFTLSVGYKDQKLEKYRSSDFLPDRFGRIKIMEIEKTDLYEDVWDITVKDNTNTFQLSHCITGNCAEIGFYCYDEYGNSGWQACNLSEINIGKCKTEQDFYDSCRAASIIGTLQAGFTEFPYLGKVSEDIIKREALLGVSMTGVMENPEISLNPSIQKRGANIVKDTNKEIAEKININQAARCCCVKPSGSAAATLGVSSGIHPHHYKRYIRRVQANKQENILNHFSKINPEAVEDSVWSANKTDSVVAFCCECKNMAKTKNDLSAIEFLENVKNTQINWVMEGKNKELCTKPWLEHNVSNTCLVKDNEWEEVTEYIYKNRKYFTGISLLSFSGDKDYPQAPFTAVYLPSQIAQEYGNGSILASGLIERALVAFNNNLWVACDAVMGIGFDYEGVYEIVLNYISGIKSEITEKHDMDIIRKQLYFVDSIKKFANKYMDGDVKKTTYLLKDVYNWKTWSDLQREYKEVDYSTMVEEQDNTNFSGEVACSGPNGCEVL